MWVERLLHVLSPVLDHKEMEGFILYHGSDVNVYSGPQQRK